MANLMAGNAGGQAIMPGGGQGQPESVKTIKRFNPGNTPYTKQVTEETKYDPATHTNYSSGAASLPPEAFSAGEDLGKKLKSIVTGQYGDPYPG